MALLLLLSGCTSPYYRVSPTSHGPIVWDRHKTLEACQQRAREDEQATRDSGLRGLPTQCLTWLEFKRVGG